MLLIFFFFQAEDGIRDLVRSRGLGDVYKRQCPHHAKTQPESGHFPVGSFKFPDAKYWPPLATKRFYLSHDLPQRRPHRPVSYTHLTLPTSDLV